MATEQTKTAEDLRREPLLAGGPENRGGAGAGFSWLTALGFAFLTFNSGMAVYRSNGDMAAVAFVAFSYVDLVLLFCCLRWFENAAPGSAARGNLKVAVWVLTTLLTLVFSYKVAAIMPVPVQILVWGMAGATVMGGFYAFFLHREGKYDVLDVANGFAQIRPTVWSWVAALGDGCSFFFLVRVVVGDLVFVFGAAPGSTKLFIFLDKSYRDRRYSFLVLQGPSSTSANYPRAQMIERGELSNARPKNENGAIAILQRQRHKESISDDPSKGQAQLSCDRRISQPYILKLTFRMLEAQTRRQLPRSNRTRLNLDFTNIQGHPNNFSSPNKVKYRGTKNLWTACNVKSTNSIR